MRGPGRPLLLGLLLVLGAAGPGVAAPREAADGQTLLRLIAEILQELRKGQAGEAKRLQLAGRREASDSALDPEEQRVGECAPGVCAGPGGPGGPGRGPGGSGAGSGGGGPGSPGWGWGPSARVRVRRVSGDTESCLLGNTVLEKTCILTG